MDIIHTHAMAPTVSYPVPPSPGWWKESWSAAAQIYQFPMVKSWEKHGENEKT